MEVSTKLRHFASVSIHAPARGATGVLTPTPVHALVSIHAPARGATDHWKIDPNSGRSFNPRSREGSDLLYLTFSFIYT